MIAICEECAKKYNVDEDKMKSERARFSCYECGHIIVVEKKIDRSTTEPESPSVFDSATDDQPLFP